jgi:hypothetical protein
MERGEDARACMVCKREGEKERDNSGINVDGDHYKLYYFMFLLSFLVFVVFCIGINPRCDRVLWKAGAPSTVNQLVYGPAHGLMTSDHSPVFAGFNVEVCVCMLEMRLVELM